MQAVDGVKANPVRLGWVPTTPDTTVPQLTVESPLHNTTYNSKEMTFGFTIDLPESWFNNAPRALNPPDGHYCNGKVLSAQISLDESPIHNFVVSNDSYLPYSSDLSLNRSLTLTENFSVPEGKHVLIIHLFAESYYSPSGNLTIVRYPISSDSTPISFYVDTSPQVTPSFSPSSSSSSPSSSPSPISSPSPSVPEFPPWLILPFLMAATVLGAIVVRRRRAGLPAIQ